MKIKAKTIAEIFKAISATSFAKKNTEDVEELNTVKIVASKNKMQILSVNSRICAAYLIPEFEGNFSVTADNAKLSSCIEAAADSDGYVEFCKRDEQLVVDGNASMPVPSGPEKQSKFICVSGEPAVSVLAADILKAIKGVCLAIKKDSETMKKVKFSFSAEDATFTMTAFNGSMLAVANIPLEDMKEDISLNHVLVDGEILLAIMPLLKCISSQIVDIYINDGKMMISCENTKITFDYSSEEFVKCEKLLEPAFESFVTFNTKELKKSLNSIYKVIKTNVEFAANGSVAAFRSGDFRMNVKFEKSNQVFFAIPITILKNILTNINEETVTISVENKVLIKIQSDDCENIVYVTGGVKTQ